MGGFATMKRPNAEIFSISKLLMMFEDHHCKNFLK